MTNNRRWQIRLTASAERDFQDIFRWTQEYFGERQANIYAETLLLAIDALTAGPYVTGAKPRDEIAEGLMTFHVAQKGRKGRHLILYQPDFRAEVPTIEVLRLLHDAMDLPRHIKPVEDAD